MQEKSEDDIQTLARPNVKEKACSFENDWCEAITFFELVFFVYFFWQEEK